MKLKTQETIRAIELNSWLGLFLLSLILNENVNNNQIQEIVKLLKDNNIDLSTLKVILSNIYTLDYLTMFKRKCLTTDYKELKQLYNEIIKNTGNFYQDLGAIDPISIFATYVYMYRSGYFSHDKQFLYSDNMKDFSQLQGLDVIRGRGVCRSISSMLTDLYREMGMTSFNIPVKTNKATFTKAEELSSIELKDEDQEELSIDEDEDEDEDQEELLIKILDLLDRILDKSIDLLDRILPFGGDHLITMVKHDNKNYILDPTNDIFLHYIKKNKLAIANDYNYYMKNKILEPGNFMLDLIGAYADGINIKEKLKQLNVNSITYEEYKQRYLQASKICIQNSDYFEHFYQQNSSIIEEVYQKSEEQNNLIRRLIPLGPFKK